jgi:hypothetical protein
MFEEQAKKLFDMIASGCLEPGELRFDASAIVDIGFISENDIIFNFASSNKRIPVDQLTQDEAMIAYKFLFEKTQKELKLAERRAVFGYLKGTMVDNVLK